MEKKIVMDKVVTRRVKKNKINSKNFKKAVAKFMQNFMYMVISGVCYQSIKTSDLYFFSNMSIISLIVTLLPTFIAVRAAISMLKIVKSYS